MYEEPKNEAEHAPILIFDTKIIRSCVIMIKIRMGAFLMKPYSDEFKANLIKLYHDEKRSKQSLANEYGAHPRPSVIGSSKLKQLNCLKVAR